MGLRGFARVILVLAWAAFWFNTALFPCCEVVAAAFGDHSDDVSQSVSARRTTLTKRLPNGHTIAPTRLATTPLMRDQRLMECMQDCQQIASTRTGSRSMYLLLLV
jgi:hypothetical protein